MKIYYIFLGALRDFSKMTLKNAKHCDGFGCMFLLGYYGFFAVFNYMVPLSMLLKKI